MIIIDTLLPRLLRALLVLKCSKFLKVGQSSSSRFTSDNIRGRQRIGKSTGSADWPSSFCENFQAWKIFREWKIVHWLVAISNSTGDSTLEKVQLLNFVYSLFGRIGSLLEASVEMAVEKAGWLRTENRLNGYWHRMGVFVQNTFHNIPVWAF